MCCGLRAVTAECHTAPSPRVGLRPVKEEQDAGLPFAGADEAEVLVADQVGDGLRERLQELLGRCPSPAPLQSKRALVRGKSGAWIAPGRDLPVSIASCQQVVQRTQIRHGFRADFPSCMSSDEAPQPFAQGSGPLGDFVERLTGAQILAEAGRVRALDRACLLEPIEEFDPIAQPLRPDAERRGPTIDKVEGQVVASEEGRNARDETGRQVSTDQMPKRFTRYHSSIVTGKCQHDKLAARS
jgi:hypothetical protein